MKKGFTLIELVIVIGILAILAATVILVLNPAQLLAKARDSQRVSDLGNVKSAIALYLATATSPSIAAAGPFSTFNATCPFGTCTVRDIYAVDNTGWVAVDLTGTSGGSALAALPSDPLNNSTSSQYSFKGDVANKTFKLTGILENSSNALLMANDGGSLGGGIYEVGTGMSL